MITNARTVISLDQKHITMVAWSIIMDKTAKRLVEFGLLDVTLTKNMLKNARHNRLKRIKQHSVSIDIGQTIEKSKKIA